MKPHSTFTADQLTSMLDHFAAFNAILGGKFDDKIKQLQQVQADITAKQKLIGDAAKIEQMRKEADDYAENVRAQADKMMANNKAYEAQLNDREAALDERERQIDNQRGQLKNDIQAHNGVVAVDRKAIADKQMELAEREKKVRDQEAKWTSIAAQVKSQQDDLNSKAERIRQATSGL